MSVINVWVHVNQPYETGIPTLIQTSTISCTSKQSLSACFSGKYSRKVKYYSFNLNLLSYYIYEVENNTLITES